MQERQKKNIASHNRSIEACNKLDAEVINARNIHDFKSKLNDSRFGDGTTSIILFLCTLELDKYTHFTDPSPPLDT